MQPAGLTFTERMQGSIACGLSDNQTENQGGLGWRSFDFVLDAVIDDVSDFVTAPDHPISLPRGWVQSDHFGTCQVTDGEINLMVQGLGRAERVMRYRVCFEDRAGVERTLLGFKRVDGDRMHLWYDTTRVFVEIYEGHLREHEERQLSTLIAIGILEIPLLTFLIQLTTFRPRGGQSGSGRALAYLRFLRFFSSALVKPYLSGLLQRTRSDVEAARQPAHVDVEAGRHRLMQSD